MRYLSVMVLLGVVACSGARTGEQVCDDDCDQFADCLGNPVSLCKSECKEWVAKTSDECVMAYDALVTCLEENKTCSDIRYAVETDDYGVCSGEVGQYRESCPPVR